MTETAVPALSRNFVAEVIDDGRISGQQILVVGLCMFFNMLDGFDITAMAVVAGAVSEELQLTADRLGLIFSFALAGMMAGAMLLAPVSDVIGRRKVIILSLILVGVSILFTANATTLAHAGVSVSTVEHLLAALSCLGVDNVRVELDGPEVPIMDGSAASFAYLIRSAGLFVQPEPRSLLVIRRPLEYADGERSIRIEPCRSFRISYAVDFDHPAIGRQEFEIAGLTPSVFEREIARARTFGFLHDVEALWKAAPLPGWRPTSRPAPPSRPGPGGSAGP